MHLIILVHHVTCFRSCYFSFNSINPSYKQLIKLLLNLLHSLMGFISSKRTFPLSGSCSQSGQLCSVGVPASVKNSIYVRRIVVTCLILGRHVQSGQYHYCPLIEKLCFNWITLLGGKNSVMNPTHQNKKTNRKKRIYIEKFCHDTSRSPYINTGGIFCGTKKKLRCPESQI